MNAKELKGEVVDLIYSQILRIYGNQFYEHQNSWFSEFPLNIVQCFHGDKCNLSYVQIHSMYNWFT